MGLSRIKINAVLSIIVATLLFSSMEVALKYASSAFNPVELNFWRFLIGGCFLLIIGLINRHNKKIIGLDIKAKELLFFAFMGFILVVISMDVFLISINLVKASTVAVLFSLNPAAAALFAVPLLGIKLTRGNIVMLSAALLGILVVLNPFATNLGLKEGTLIFIATTTFGLYSVLTRRLNIKFGLFFSTGLVFLFGALELLVIIIICELPVIAQLFDGSALQIFVQINLLKGLTLTNLPIFIYVCVFVTGVGFASWFFAQQQASPEAAALVFYLKPLVSSIIAALFLGEIISVNMVVGIAIIVAGSFLSGYIAKGSSASAAKVARRGLEK